MEAGASLYSIADTKMHHTNQGNVYNSRNHLPMDDARQSEVRIEPSAELSRAFLMKVVRLQPSTLFPRSLTSTI